VASKWMPVTDVEEAWRLRQAGLLHFRNIPAMTTSAVFPKHLHVVDDDEDNNEEQ
jgi:hypothetical protein